MNFARAWISRLISLVTGVRPYMGTPNDRLQAARGEDGRFISPTRQKVKANARAMRAAFGLPESEALL